MDKIIKLSDISKVYGEEIQTVALKKINLTIEEGEFCSIIGPSGSGKSSLLNILGLLDIQSFGIYELDGVDTASLSRSQLSKYRNEKLGFVFQFHHLLPEFTVMENVLMPFSISKKRITKEIIERAERNIEIAGIMDRKNYSVTKLSGGQKQRTAIARALMNNPKVVLADEPTGNLDSESTEKIYSLLRSINKEYNTTFIIVTHDRHLASKSDRVIEIIDGDIHRDIRIDENSQRKAFQEIRPCNCYLAHDIIEK